jgi:hypothetical protein
MELSKAIKKLEKAGFSLNHNGNCYVASKAENREQIEFFSQKREDEKGKEIWKICCIKVVSKGEKSMPEVDYFPGTFVDNITQAIKWTR